MPVVVSLLFFKVFLWPHTPRVSSDEVEASHVICNIVYAYVDGDIQYITDVRAGFSMS